ncbi:hypothetical protein P6P90_08430 [Ectobacillus antri]|jgi:hypothetical protein|uniref:Uncharacterized protein n=1 Tax=Ectobacillus antri TaxID=2486280 RepID=A0ABT6H4N2_9BACI|nr:hypothetical protein [Ectobacillus antri]MDG4656637.1 hypothetical protein [Ectobacillus antri]MDG5754000.1 hypothetical protein [Ectobacillus antri]
MRKKIMIESAERTERALIFYAKPVDIQVDDLRAKQHMLVDSDELAFLYILEGEDYVYVSIPHTVWSSCKELNEHVKVVALINNVEIELEGLQEELAYLIANIEGNANYGEELVNKVEQIFLA